MRDHFTTKPTAQTTQKTGGRVSKCHGYTQNYTDFAQKF